MKIPAIEWLKDYHIDKAAKKFLEENISSSTATWDSLQENAVLKEHFRYVARGRKKA